SVARHELAPGRTSDLDAGRAVLGADDLELDATVALPRLRVVPRIDRAALAVARAAQALAGDASLDERLHDGGRTVTREADVVLVARSLVGVSLHLDERDVRVADQRGRDRVDDREAPRLDL